MLQSDGYLWSSIPGFGVYYIFSTPISAVGLLAVVKRAVSNFKMKKFGYEMVLLIWLVSALIMAFTQNTGTNLTRINPMNPAMFILVAAGIEWIVGKIRFHKAEAVAVGIYAVSFICFMAYYFTGYRDTIAQRQLAGAGEALEYACELYETGAYGNKIRILGSLRHSQVLFYTQFPTDDYIETVDADVVENGTYNVKGFGCFTWEDSPEEGKLYVIPADNVSTYTNSGYETEMFGQYAVAAKK